MGISSQPHRALFTDVSHPEPRSMPHSFTHVQGASPVIAGGSRTRESASEYRRQYEPPSVNGPLPPCHNERWFLITEFAFTTVESTLAVAVGTAFYAVIHVSGLDQ